MELVHHGEVDGLAVRGEGEPAGLELLDELADGAGVQEGHPGEGAVGQKVLLGMVARAAQPPASLASKASRRTTTVMASMRTLASSRARGLEGGVLGAGLEFHRRAQGSAGSRIR